MAARVIEAKLVISGEDKGASSSVENVVKSIRHLEEVSKISQPLQKMAKDFQQVEQVSKAVNAALSARTGYATAEAGMKATQSAAQATAKALNEARAARAAFDGVKAAAGSAVAKEIEAATKAVRDYTTAQRKADGDVRRTTAAMAAQASTLQHAEASAKALGADLGALEAHQQRLRSATESATSAIRAQIRVEDQSARVAQARQARRDAWKGAAGIVGLSAVHGAEHFAGHALHTYQHFDNERRFGKVVMDLTDAQQKPLVDQAIHMGAISRYNDVKVLHAQRELAARGLGRDQVLGMIPHVKDLGQALDIDIGDAAKLSEAAIFAFKKDISTQAATERAAKQTADVQVKAAKISGMMPNDIEQAYHYGATPARLAHVSEERMLAFAGVLKKATIGGDESGVAFRALMSTTNAPTAGAKVAMRAAGLDYNNYQKAPDKLALEPFVKQVAESYGVQLDAKAKAGLGKIFSNKALVGDSSKFTPAVMDFLSDALDGDDAKSKKSIAGLANRYRNASMKGVDSDRLIDDLLTKMKDNLPLANALFGPKQGGRIATALSDAETFEKMQHLLRDHSEGFASKVSDARMAGFDGAVKRFEGAVTNLETKLGRAWDGGGSGGILTDVTSKAGQFVQHLAEMDDGVVRAGSAAAALASGFVAIKSLGLLQSGFGLKTSAVALDHSALALEAAAVKLAGGSLGDLPGGGPGGKGNKGGKLKGAVKAGVGVAGALGLEPLAELAQEHHIFEMPDVAKDGWLRAGLNFLDPNAANALLGDSAKAMPSMTLAPGAMPLTIQGSGISGGLSGPVNPDTAGKEAGEMVGSGVIEGIRAKAPAVLEQGRQLFEGFVRLFGQGVEMPINFKLGDGSGTGSGIQNAAFGGAGGGLGGMIRRASLGGDGAIGGLGGAGGIARAGTPAARGQAGIGTGAGDSWHEAVMRAEGTSGADPYNTVLGYGAYGKPDKPITQMRIGEVLAYQKQLLHNHGSASAVGAFQIVGKTLAHHAREMGLSHDTLFSPEVQRRVADHIRRTEGWGAWKGFEAHPGELAIARRLGAYVEGGAGVPGGLAGLRVKGGLGGQAFAGGPTDPALLSLARQLQKGGGVDRFTAFNDRYHAGSGSMHARGLATDVTGDPARIMANTRAMMEAAGLAEGRDYRILDEYAHRSRRATGGARTHRVSQPRGGRRLRADAADGDAGRQGRRSQGPGSGSGADAPAPGRARDPGLARAPDDPRAARGRVRWRRSQRNGRSPRAHRRAGPARRPVRGCVVPRSDRPGFVRRAAGAGEGDAHAHQRPDLG